MEVSTTHPILSKWILIECFHSRGQHLCKFIGTKESVCIRKQFNSHRTSLGHQHGGRFIVLGHQYGRRYVMWKHSIYWHTLRLGRLRKNKRFCKSQIFMRHHLNRNLKNITVFSALANRKEKSRHCYITMGFSALGYVQTGRNNPP